MLFLWFLLNRLESISLCQRYCLWERSGSIIFTNLFERHRRGELSQADATECVSSKCGDCIVLQGEARGSPRGRRRGRRAERTRVQSLGCEANIAVCCRNALRLRRVRVTTRREVAEPQVRKRMKARMLLGAPGRTTGSKGHRYERSDRTLTRMMTVTSSSISRLSPKQKLYVGEVPPGKSVSWDDQTGLPVQLGTLSTVCGPFVERSCFAGGGCQRCAWPSDKKLLGTSASLPARHLTTSSKKLLVARCIATKPLLVPHRRPSWTRLCLPSPDKAAVAPTLSLVRRRCCVRAAFGPNA